MYKSNIENILQKKNIRENLILIKNQKKDEKVKRSLAYYLEGDYEIFTSLMKHSDPKIRRNAALIMGELEDDDLLPVIFETYKDETTLYIRADLLKAMSNYDYHIYIDEFKVRLDELKEASLNDIENLKHYEEEIKTLRQMLYSSEYCKHELIGETKRAQLYLTAYPGCMDILVSCLKKMQKRLAVAGTGVMVYDTCIEELKEIRLYRELLFPVIEDAKYRDGKDLAKLIIGSNIISLLHDFFDGNMPFTYRLQIRGIREENRSLSLVKEIVSRLDKTMSDDLVNTVSDYQIELRLIIKSSDSFALYVKPNLLKDSRFEYRKSSTSESMKPVLAANICEYCSKYFKENAAVIDPFCGSGILLIERNIKKAVSRSMGIDLLALAIEAMKKNVAYSGYNINAVCRNFFDFENKAEYMVDELITDLPRVSSKRNEAYIFKLYGKFLQRAVSFVKEGGYLFLYTNLPAAIKENLNTNLYELLEEKLMRAKDNSTLFVIKVGKR